MKVNSQNPYFRKSFIQCFTVITVLSLFSSPAWTQNTWTDGGGDDAWGTAANWSGGVPADTDQLIFGDDPSNAAQTINTGGNRTLENEILIESSGNRDYTIQGNTLDFLRTNAGPVGIESGAGTTDLTVDSDITISESIGSGNIYFDITGSGTRTIFLNGDISLGTGARPRSIRMNAANSILRLSGSNSVAVRFVNGEVVAASADAVAAQWQQGGGNSVLSVTTDLNAGNSNGAATFLTGNVDLRIVSDAPSSADRTLTFSGRLNAGGDAGQLTLVSNVNSTGRIILHATNSHNTAANNLAVDLGSNGLLRFSNSGTSLYGSSDPDRAGTISGQGDVEILGGGTLVYLTTHTYSGSTSISNASTLLLSGGGGMTETSRLDIEAGSTLDISDISADGYTFEGDQTVAGSGLISTGGKDLTLNGTLAPGSSPGTLTVDMGVGTFSLGASTNLQFELGTASDLVDLTSGTLDIGTGTLGFDDFSFTDGAGFGVGQYTLFQTTESILGSFAGNTTGTVGGFSGELQFSGNDLILDVSVVPEPGTASLLLGGLALALLGRRCRKSS